MRTGWNPSGNRKPKTATRYIEGAEAVVLDRKGRKNYATEYNDCEDALLPHEPIEGVDELVLRNNGVQDVLASKIEITLPVRMRVVERWKDSRGEKVRLKNMGERIHVQAEVLF